MGTLTEQAKRKLTPVLGEGALAVDATAGNGHDSLFLAQAVGAAGHVWACDIQPGALESTASRLQQEGVAERVTLVQEGHERLDQWLPHRVHGRLGAVMFNLGYLPGGDQTQVTTPQTTIAALSRAASLLAPGGCLTVLVYRAHAGALEEYRQVLGWCQGSHLSFERFDGVEGPCGTGPVLFVVTLAE